MQIVIELSDEIYKDIKEENSIYGTKNGLSTTITDKVVGAIQNGTPLPKRHGRLIDADELLTSERPKGIADDVWKESHIYKLLSNAPTIIEADE